MKEPLASEPDISGCSLESFNTCDDCGIVFQNMGVWYQHRQKHLCRSIGLEAPANVSCRNRRMLCHFCDKTCSNLANLASHQRKHFEELFNDSHCNYEIPPVSSFSEIYPKQEQFKCEYCQKIFPFQWHLLQHKWDVHRYNLETNEVTYECLCGKYFLLESNLRMHRERACAYWSSRKKSTSMPKRRATSKKQPQESTFNCIYCYRTFLTAAYLERHLEQHNDTTVCECEFCGKKFLEQERLDSHLEKVHVNSIKKNDDRGFRLPRGKTYECKKCSRFFYVKGNFEKHQQQADCESVKLLQCDLCPRKFVDFRGLHRHRMTHTGELSSQLFDCEDCGQQFLTLTTLWKHRDRDHSGKPNIEPKNDNDVQLNEVFTRNGRKCRPTCVFKCTYCTQRFSKLITLQKHEICHTAETPYGCEHCPKKFSTSSDLKRHRKGVHRDILAKFTSTSSFSCENCSSQFGTLYELREHESSVHFSCNICGEQFQNEEGFLLHLKSKHDERKRKRSSSPEPDERSGVTQSEVEYFFCELCNSSFIHEEMRDQHQRFYHALPASPTSKSDANELACFFCDDNFGNFISFELHLLSEHDYDFKNQCFLSEQAEEDHSV